MRALTGRNRILLAGALLLIIALHGTYDAAKSYVEDLDKGGYETIITLPALMLVLIADAVLVLLTWGLLRGSSRSRKTIIVLCTLLAAGVLIVALDVYDMLQAAFGPEDYQPNPGPLPNWPRLVLGFVVPAAAVVILLRRPEAARKARNRRAGKKV